MTVTEKTAYLKGLLEGLKIDDSTDQGKLLTVIVETLNDIALAVSDLESDAAETAENVEMLEDAIDDIDEELEEMEETIDDICEVLEDCCDCDCDDEDDDECDCGCDETFYQLACPTCGEEICVDKDVLEKGGMKCPACGEELEFDLSLLDDEDDDEKDCGCEHCK